MPSFIHEQSNLNVTEINFIFLSIHYFKNMHYTFSDFI